MGPWQMLLPCPCPSCPFLCNHLSGLPGGPRLPSLALYFQALLLFLTFCKGSLPYRASPSPACPSAGQLCLDCRLSGLPVAPLAMHSLRLALQGSALVDACLSCPASDSRSHHVCVRKAPPKSWTISARKCGVCSYSYSRTLSVIRARMGTRFTCRRSTGTWRLRPGCQMLEVHARRN